MPGCASYRSARISGPTFPPAPAFHENRQHHIGSDARISSLLQPLDLVQRTRIQQQEKRDANTKTLFIKTAFVSSGDHTRNHSDTKLFSERRYAHPSFPTLRRRYARYDDKYAQTQALTDRTAAQHKPTAHHPSHPLP